jgi:hypothetical protein
MSVNPCGASRECGIRVHKPRTWHGFAITVGITIGVMAAIALLDLLGFWLSLKLSR